MSAVRRAALVAVGDELLAGAHPDLNSPVLSRRLLELGVKVEHVELVSDDRAEIAGAVRAALQRAGLVVVTGGLGPTLDDETRQGIADGLGRELVCDEEARRQVEAWFERRGTPCAAANLRQALLPAGAELLPNRVGTAPGFRAEHEGRVVAALPGPPPEMRIVLEEELLPWLIATGRAAAPLGEHRFHLFGLSESVFAEEAGAWMDREASPLMGCSAKKGVLSVVLRARGPDGGAVAALAERVAAFRERFGRHVFSEDEPHLELVLGRELLASGTSVTVAESCTGGLVAELLTRVPGISAVFGRGFVTYSDEAKVAQLGVEPGLLESCGAVSSEVAAAMASGAARASGAELAVAVTGVAGPGGGSPDKPVGLVRFATWAEGQARTAERRFPPGQRQWIRALAARTALHLALERLRERVASD